MSARYVRAATVDEAVTALRQTADAVPLAGGTDLMLQLRLGHRSPSVVVDTSGLHELHSVHIGPDGVRLGAGVTMRDLLASPEVVAAAPALAEAARLLGGPQIQAVATLGGNVGNASPAAETVPPLLVHRALAEVVGPDGLRTLPLAELLVSPRRLALGPGELLRTFVLPPAPGGSRTRSAYRRVELRRSVDIAVVSAAVALDVDEGRVVGARAALGAVAPTAVSVDVTDLLVGAYTDDLDGHAGAELASRVGRACAEVADPIDDLRASAHYRRQMVDVVARRAVLACLATPPNVTSRSTV